MTLNDALNKYFGFSEFRPHQEEVVRNALAGKDQMVVLPTGAENRSAFSFLPYCCRGVPWLFRP